MFRKLSDDKEDKQINKLEIIEELSGVFFEFLIGIILVFIGFMIVFACFI